MRASVSGVSNRRSSRFYSSPSPNIPHRAPYPASPPISAQRRGTASGACCPLEG